MVIGNLPETVTNKELSDFIGLSLPAITKLVDAGVVVRIRPNTYDFKVSVGNYIRQLREAAARHPGGVQTLELTAERARLAKEQADAMEIKNSTARGELVSALETEQTWSAAMIDMRSRFLSIPSRVRQRIPQLTAAEVGILDEELRAAMLAYGSGQDVK